MSLFKKAGRIFNSPSGSDTVSIGTAGTGVTAVNYDDGRDITTVLTLTNVDLGITPAALRGVGALIFTFPAGNHVHIATYMNVSLTAGAGNAAVTADLGIGSVIANGAISVLGGTATFENYITGQSTADCAGTPVEALTTATAGVLTGISLSVTGTEKRVYLNAAATWVASEPLLANGTITLKWCKMS
jgi:hypothetical protein